jgi:ferredoxin
MVIKNKKVFVVFLVLAVVSLTVFAAKKNITHVIDQKACTQCGKCINACTVDAIKVTIVDGKKRHEIDPLKCTQCGLCIDACEEEAILVNTNKIEKSVKAKSK